MTRRQDSRTVRAPARAATRAGAGVALLVAVVGLAGCGTEAATRDADRATAREAADSDGVITPADGYLSERVAPSSDVAAVTGLDPALRQALLDASRDAADEGIDIMVTSGWRSAEYQQSLLDDAVAEYGSLAEARRWVETPGGSAHVSGDAVDVGPTDAAYWMSRHGSRYGLCQTYSNEVWHYELTTEPGGECPAPLGDAA
ncbi:hypothetical protein GCM10023169_38160 [Georgenia halophila]|uniref:D-alanyl-D-alanine carboxypeptidase-like core domain-containing protein n=1 Tax=Georgenia halophila TaxID=620889 RepID=A0ABP8LM94_9MICO